jgi:hypothetical protein
VPAFDSISQDQLLDRIVGTIEFERTRRPAFTLLLGSGFSAPLIPTAGQVVASDVAWWLFWRRQVGPWRRPGGPELSEAVGPLALVCS